MTGNCNISIIIPHYNNDRGLKRLLDSISCAKDASKIEIVIVDDYSDVKVFSNIKELTQKYPLNIKLIQNVGAKGVGSARNIGILNASGKWLIFADSDDVFLKNYGEEIGKYLDSDADVIFFPPTSFEQIGLESIRHRTYLKPFKAYWKNGNEDSLRHELPTVWSRLFKREFVIKNQIKFDEDLFVAEDGLFAIKLGVYAKKIAVSSAIIYAWMFSANSLTTGLSKERFEIIVKSAIRSNQFLKKHLMPNEYRKNRKTMARLMAMAFFRQRLGLIYTIKLFVKLWENDFPVMRLRDFCSVVNFFQNNFFYRKAN